MNPLDETATAVQPMLALPVDEGELAQVMADLEAILAEVDVDVDIPVEPHREPEVDPSLISATIGLDGEIIQSVDPLRICGGPFKNGGPACRGLKSVHAYIYGPWIRFGFAVDLSFLKGPRVPRPKILNPP